MVPVLSTAKSKNDGRHTNDGMIGNLLWRAPESFVLYCKSAIYEGIFAAKLSKLLSRP